MTADVTSSSAGGPQAGVRVIEVSAGRAGRIAGMLLADLGADVLLVSATLAGIAASGLTSQRLRAAAPEVVHAWLPPYGEVGEWRDLPEDPLFLAALTGLAVHLPADDASPVAPVVPTLSSIRIWRVSRTGRRPAWS